MKLIIKPFSEAVKNRFENFYLSIWRLIANNHFHSNNINESSPNQLYPQLLSRDLDFAIDVLDQIDIMYKSLTNFSGIKPSEQDFREKFRLIHNRLSRHISTEALVDILKRLNDLSDIDSAPSQPGLGKLNVYTFAENTHWMRKPFQALNSNNGDLSLAEL